MPRDRFVTMADVARAAGVHVSTVSLSLRNSPLIPAETKKEVQAAADRLNYRPHPHIATLMQRRRSGKQSTDAPVLGFVTAFDTRDGWRKVSPLFTGFLRGARQRGEQKGFRLDEFWMHESGMTARRFNEVLLTRNIHGLLLAPHPEPEGLLDLDWTKFSTVGLGLTFANPVHRVSHDHFGAMLVAVEKCRALGYRRIGFATNAVVHRKVQLRWLAAFLVKQAETPDDPTLPALVSDNWSEPVVRAWYEKHKPDVIISNHPVPLRDWITSWRLQIPRDLGLVNLSGSSPSETTSGIDQQADLMGSRAVDLLVGLLEQNETGLTNNPNTLLVQGTWNPGKTLKKQ